MCLLDYRSSQSYALSLVNSAENRLQLVSGYYLRLPISGAGDGSNANGFTVDLTDQANHQLPRQGDATDDGVSRSVRNNENVTYLEDKLFRRLDKWLAKSSVWRQVKNVARRVIKSYLFELISSESAASNMHGHRRDGHQISSLWASAVGQDDNNITTNSPNFRHEQRSRSPTPRIVIDVAEEESKAKLVRVLEVARVINSLLMVCHGLIIFKSVDYCAGWSQFLRSTSTLPSLSDWFGVTQLSESTSWLVASDEEQLGHMLLVTNLFDMCANIYWHHAQMSFRRVKRGDSLVFGQCNEPSLLQKSILQILISPRHLFQVSYAALLVNSLKTPSASNEMSFGASLLNCHIQVLRYGYNLHRVSQYLKIIRSSQRVDINNNERVDECLWTSSCPEPNTDWSHWPVPLFSCECTFQESALYLFEKLQMLLEVTSVKLSTLTLLFQLDAKGGADAPRLLCLLLGFLTLHFNYDKYHRRYMAPSGGEQRPTC